MIYLLTSVSFDANRSKINYDMPSLDGGIYPNCTGQLIEIIVFVSNEPIVGLTCVLMF